MYIKSECDSVCTEYKKMVKERSVRLTKIWSYIFVGYLVVMIVIPLIPNLLDGGTGRALYAIYGGLIFVGLFIAILVSMFSISDVPAFNYLYKEMYNKINLEEGTTYDYEGYEKGKFEFNKLGGLFSRFCRYEVKRHVSGLSPGNNSFDIFDVTLVTGSGKNRHEHFKGIYFITKYTNRDIFQLRSHTKPHHKEIKYTRLNEFEEIRVFVEEEKSMSNIAHKYISTIDRFKKNLKAKKMYLSIVKDEIHFAYVPKTQIRKQYNLTIDKMNQLLKTFQYEIEVIDELIETSSY